MKPSKTVCVDGMTWSVISRNERATTIAGRHFFARRCRPSAPWSVHEHDQDIVTSGQAKPLRVYQEQQWTHELTGFVNDVMMGAETPWLPFDQHRAQQKARVEARHVIRGDYIPMRGSPDATTADGRALEFKHGQ